MPREGDYEQNQVIPGTVYLVIRLLGSGGMGTVYEVEDTTVGKRYVLKTLHADLRERKELAMRISKEARTLAKLSHANIVEVVTAGATADDLRLPYFVMQKLNGHTLRSILAAKGRLPLETAYGIAIDLLDALEHAHAFGVIHRDVKPENIFIHRNVNGSYVTKLLDFGVMRLLSSEVGQTGHRFVGTLRYAPPEQLLGGAITPRTDLYSAGLVLYEMIAGVGPFGDEPNDREVASAHLEKEPPPLSAHLAVPPALDRLVASALSKDPAGRPRDATTFAATLRELSRELGELRKANPSMGALGNVDAVVALVAAPPSMTNLDEMTRADSAPSGETWASPPSTAAGGLVSRPASGTLEDAHPPAQIATAPQQHTLRMATISSPDHAAQLGQIDRAAATNTMVPIARIPPATANTDHFDVVRAPEGGDDALAMAPTMPSPERAIQASTTSAITGRTMESVGAPKKSGLLFVVYGAAAIAFVATAGIVGAVAARKSSRANHAAVSVDPQVTLAVTSAPSAGPTLASSAAPVSPSSSAVIPPSVPTLDAPQASAPPSASTTTTQGAKSQPNSAGSAAHSVIPSAHDSPSPTNPRASSTPTTSPSVTPHGKTRAPATPPSAPSKKLPGPGF